MLEPLLSPAADAQALGRVHRLGQAQATHVHRFVVRSTVEERVAQLCARRAEDPRFTQAGKQARNGKRFEVWLFIDSRPISLFELLLPFSW